MPGNGFTFTVRVRGQEDFVGFQGCFPELGPTNTWTERSGSSRFRHMGTGRSKSSTYPTSGVSGQGLYRSDRSRPTSSMLWFSTWKPSRTHPASADGAAATTPASEAWPASRWTAAADAALAGGLTADDAEADDATVFVGGGSLAFSLEHAQEILAPTRTNAVIAPASCRHMGRVCTRYELGAGVSRADTNHGLRRRRRSPRLVEVLAGWGTSSGASMRLFLV